MADRAVQKRKYHFLSVAERTYSRDTLRKYAYNLLQYVLQESEKEDERII